MVAGHGTPRNPNSKSVVFDVVSRLRALRLYGDCQGVFMEEPPFIRDWAALTDRKNVIVVPFFISDGLHSSEDIPVMLGITGNVREQAFQNPSHVQGRRVWYARALGAEPRLAEVIVALARDAARSLGA